MKGVSNMKCDWEKVFEMLFTLLGVLAGLFVAYSLTMRGCQGWNEQYMKELEIQAVREKAMLERGMVRSYGGVWSYPTRTITEPKP